MARPTIMDAKSAMPAKIKRETTSNELLRRLLNTSQGLPSSEEDMVVAVNRYMVEMRNSGYDERYRLDTLTNSVKGFRRKVEEDVTGRRPLYREAKEGEREKHLGRISASAKWFKRRREPDQSEEDFHRKGPMRKSPWRKMAPPKGQRA